MSRFDDLFKGTIIRIIDEMNLVPCRPVWEDGTPSNTLKTFGVVNEYYLEEEFPAPTLRPVPLKSCVDELLWIWQKKSNDVRELNSKIWDQWAGEDHTIGKAYGWQVANKLQTITVNGEKKQVDQTDYILNCLKNEPQSRRIIANLYNIEDLDEMNLHPCCYSITFNVVGETLNMILNQRSSDLIVAGAWNVVQYSVLLHMFAQVSNLKPGRLIHVVSDCHIYDRHTEIALKLLERESLPAPKLWINPEITNFYDFTVDDVKLINYEHHEQIKNIPVAI